MPTSACDMIVNRDRAIAALGVRVAARALVENRVIRSVAAAGHPLYFFFFNDTAPTEISTLSLHDALPICVVDRQRSRAAFGVGVAAAQVVERDVGVRRAGDSV